MFEVSGTMRAHSYNYRAFRVSPDNRIGVPVTSIEAWDDDEALQQAQLLVEGYPVELWDRGRFVARLEPTDKPYQGWVS